MSLRYEVRVDDVKNDTVVGSLPPGSPWTWHSQRCDSLVFTQNAGLVYYGKKDGTHFESYASCASSRIQLTALRALPLGLSCYGDLVATISNPCALMDFSSEGATVLPLFHIDVETMVTSLQMLRWTAPRSPCTAPIDAFLVMFATNDGDLIVKQYQYGEFFRYLHRKRLRRLGSPFESSTTEPRSKIEVWVRSRDSDDFQLKSAHDAVSPPALNDFAFRPRHPDRNYADLFLCFDDKKIEIHEVRMHGRGMENVTTVTLLRRLLFDPVVASRLMESSGACGGGQAAVVPESPNIDARCPELERMTHYFTYIAIDDKGTTLVATADMDQTIAVFSSCSASEPPPASSSVVSNLEADVMQLLLTAYTDDDDGDDDNDVAEGGLTASTAADGASAATSDVATSTTSKRSSHSAPPNFTLRYVFKLRNLRAADNTSLEKPTKVVCVGSRVFVVALRSMFAVIDADVGSMTMYRFSHVKFPICGVVADPQSSTVYIARTVMDVAASERRHNDIKELIRRFDLSHHVVVGAHRQDQQHQPAEKEDNTWLSLVEDTESCALSSNARRVGMAVERTDYSGGCTAAASPLFDSVTINESGVVTEEAKSHPCRRGAPIHIVGTKLQDIAAKWLRRSLVSLLSRTSNTTPPEMGSFVAEYIQASTFYCRSGHQLVQRNQSNASHMRSIAPFQEMPNGHWRCHSCERPLFHVPLGDGDHSSPLNSSQEESACSAMMKYGWYFFVCPRCAEVLCWRCATVRSSPLVLSTLE